MTAKNQTYGIRIVPLSPLHIGCGKNISPSEYVFTESKPHLLRRFAPDDILRLLTAGESETLQKIGGDYYQARRFLAEKLREKHQQLQPLYDAVIDEKRVKLWDREIPATLMERYAANMRKLRDDNETNVLEIALFSENPFGKLIPGSSVKGAMRTVIEEKLHEITGRHYEEDRNDITSYFQHLMVSDSAVFTANIRVGTGVRAAPKFMEYITAGEYPAQLTFRMARIGGQQAWQTKGLPELCWDFVAGACNTYARKRIAYAAEWLRGEHADLSRSDTDEHHRLAKLAAVLKNYERILARIPEQDQSGCILNLGFGGGALFKMYTKKNGGKHLWKKPVRSRDPNDDGFVRDCPRTFWRIEEQLMGWVLIERDCP